MNIIILLYKADIEKKPISLIAADHICGDDILDALPARLKDTFHAHTFTADEPTVVSSVKDVLELLKDEP